MKKYLKDWEVDLTNCDIQIKMSLFHTLVQKTVYFEISVPLTPVNKGKELFYFTGKNKQGQ